ncbi:MAG: tol-pal system protein YbgF, partial [Nitrospirota bacterium]|nr:tol-pal system protein YbgF [Nitrospirota bacterium]
ADNSEGGMPPVPAGDPSEIYQKAYGDFSRGNYDLAITGFEEFLSDFPDAMLAPNAQYWLGECYYSRKEFDKAIVEFDKVIKNYQGAIKVPSAYLKKGFSMDALGNREAAKAQYRKIVDAYPLAPEAAIAKEKLKQKK